MGLFKSKQVTQVNEKIDHVQEFENIWLNLSEKMMRVTFTTEEPYLKDVDVVAEDDIIRLTHSGILIAEIGKRSKAFEELKSKAGIRALSMTFQKETGDYGEYYHCRMKFAGTSSYIIGK